MLTNIYGKLDCLTASIFGKSPELVAEGKDNGFIYNLLKGWEYSHWATHVPSFHRLNLWCLKIVGRNLWGERAVQGGVSIFEVCVSSISPGVLFSNDAVSVCATHSPKTDKDILLTYR
jgi:hypothetical protein